MDEQTSQTSPTPTRQGLRRIASRTAADHDGVLTRTALADLEVTRQATGREIRAGRWAAHGVHTVALHTGPLSPVADRWRAVWEVGAEAALDGVSALQAAGLTGFDSDLIHVSVPSTHRPRPVPGVRIHVACGRDAHDVIAAGIPRVRPEVAAVRAAHWAASDRQAALVVCMAAQQRLLAGPRLLDQLGRRHGRTRRAFVAQLLRDVADGAQALGELDFAALCRRRRLPRPTRQVVRTTARGRIYLDVAWEDHGVVVEVDGAQHRQGLAVTADNLRRNDLALGEEIVITIDLVGLRLQTHAFLDQVATALEVGASRRAA
jgi:very-short-patch-repair endonuclease